GREEAGCLRCEVCRRTVRSKNMNEMVELNDRVLALLGGPDSENEILIGRNDQLEEHPRLPSTLRPEVDALRDNLNQVVPDDFDYTLCLGGDLPDLMLDFH